MYRSFLSAASLAIALFGSAQSYVHQVLVLNEGYYDYFNGGGQLVPVTLGSYDPVSGLYTTVATITGPRFGTDVLVDGASIYVAADDRILRYDADSYALLDQTEVLGVRKLAVWNDQLLITRGELGGLSHYFEVRDKNDFSFLYSIAPEDGLPFSAEEVLVHDNKAYLAVNNSFDFANVQGRIGTVDLVAQTYGNEVDLGVDGLNPERLMVKDGSIYAFSNKDFTGSSISKVSNGALDYIHNVAENSGCAASALVGSKVYYMEYDQNKLARYDLNTGSVLDTLVESPGVYGLIEDPINSVLYATTTDYFSSGDLHVLDLDGQVQSTVPVSVSPGNLALDIRSSTGITHVERDALRVFPNPAVDDLTAPLQAIGHAQRASVIDASGRVVYSALWSGSGPLRLSVGDLAPGLYTLSVEGSGTTRFSKR